MKHTPAPWKVMSDCIPTRSRAITEDDKRTIIVSGKLIARVGMDKPEEIDYPNTRLIAAAPELLEALEAIFDLCSDNEPDYKRIQDCARAAIEKATA